MAPYINSENTSRIQSKNEELKVEAFQNLKTGLSHGRRLADGYDGLKPEMRPTDKDTKEPIAVIGLSLKFPGDATSPERFWSMMMEKKCASKDYPPDRMNIDAFYHPDANKLNKVNLALSNSLT